MIFTRYLYEKSRVEYSLFVALLNRDEDQALFWTYELYFSGFRRETFVLLWKYYFLLYAPFYVRFEKYLRNITKEWLYKQDDHTIIGSFVVNMVIKEPCVDFYFMYYMSDICSYPRFILPFLERMKQLDAYDLMSLYVEFIETYPPLEKREPVVERICDVLNSTMNLLLFDYELKCMAIVSRMLSHLFLRDPNNHIDSKMFIRLEPYDIKEYLQRSIVIGKSWKTPAKKCVYTQLIAPNMECVNIYQLQDWRYLSWQSPVWSRRMLSFGGELDEENKRIIFENDDKEEKFHNMYDLEPDEQSREVVECWYGEKKFQTWKEIYDRYTFPILTEWLEQNLND